MSVTTPDVTTTDLRFCLRRRGIDSVKINKYLTKNETHMILLNYHFPCDWQSLWMGSTLRICCDGGANRLYDAVVLWLKVCDNSNDSHDHSQTFINDNAMFLQYVPTVIIGDLDSIRDDVKAAYNACGVPIIQVPDQDSTDLQKALQWLLLNRSVMQSHVILVIGAFGGRFDSEMSNIAVASMFPTLCIMLMSCRNLACILPSGKHRLLIRDSSILFNYNNSKELDYPLQGSHENPIVSVIPIGEPCEYIWTEGLRWDMKGCRLSFGPGGLVSTSNEAVDSCISLTISHPVLFTVQRYIISQIAPNEISTPFFRESIQASAYCGICCLE